MNKKQTIFLTGATGLLGSYLLKLFLENDHKVYVLARSKNGKSAKERVYDYVRFWDESLLPSPSRRGHGECKIFHFEKGGSKGIYERTSKEDYLTVIEGDITYHNIGIRSPKVLDELTAEVEVIYHSAASTNITTFYDIIKKTNVDGTKNILDFAHKCKKTGCLKKVNHISTAYVAGDIGAIDFTEDMLELGQGFNNAYEQTKYEAELLVKEYKNKNLAIAVFRPSMIIGDSKTGKTTDFRLFFSIIRCFSQGIYDTFPIDTDSFQNFINVDVTSKAIYFIGQNLESSVYNIVNTDNVNIRDLFKKASNFFNFKLPTFLPLSWTPAQKILAEPYLTYFNYKTKIISKKTKNILNMKNIPLLQIDDKNLMSVFEYCKKREFIKV